MKTYCSCHLLILLNIMSFLRNLFLKSLLAWKKENGNKQYAPQRGAKEPIVSLLPILHLQFLPHLNLLLPPLASPPHTAEWHMGLRYEYLSILKLGH